MTTLDQSLTRRRRTPSQERSRETVEAVLAAASAIIEEDGIAALTTNAVARRAGVSITAVYGYFPDKWAIVHELFERFERLRGDALKVLFEDFATVPDWGVVIDRVWDEMARLRAEDPAGLALRRALYSAPRLTELDTQGTERSTEVLVDAMLERRPELDRDDAYPVAWAATLVAGTLLDDVVRDGTVDQRALAEGKKLIKMYIGSYLDGPR